MSAGAIAIVGCGMGGMAAAIALARAGHTVTVFERFERPRPLGAGLLLQPTGLAALERLGLRHAVETRGARVDALFGATPKGREVLNLVYARFSPEAYGLGVHRATLFDALFAALSESGARLVTGMEIAGVVAGASAWLDATDGRRFGPFDLVVGADGAHSTLRAPVAPDAIAPLNRWGALWTVRPDPGRRWAGTLRQVYAGARVMIGVLPIGQAPDGTPSVALFWSLRADRLAAWAAAGLDAWREEVGRHWPEAAALLDGLDDPEAVAFATYRDVRARRWRSGPVVLLGDAAHGTSPQLGQGANLALVDGLSLADAVSAHRSDIPTALAAFEAARRPWTGWTQLLSRALTPAFQSDAAWIGWARDVTLPIATRLPVTERLMLATLTGAARMPGLRRGPPRT